MHALVLDLSAFVEMCLLLRELQDKYKPLTSRREVTFLLEKSRMHIYRYLSSDMEKAMTMEKVMVPHSTILAWRIPRMEERGRLQSMGLLRVGHD